MTAVLLALAGLWAWIALRDLQSVATLPDLPPLREHAPVPDVTVVMAVRDDVAHVEQTVRQLLAQRRVNLRLVVVDDRSTDGTADVLARLRASEPRLEVITVRELPPDWLGKSHALHVGSQDVATRWLLFTDADAHLAPDTLARAIDAAERADAQHVALLPGNRGTTFPGRVCLLAFQLVVMPRINSVNAVRQRSFVGTGAFNLVRTDAYRKIGGHVPLRLEVVDDVWLGCLLWRARFRTRVWFAPNAIAVDWGATPGALVRVVEKNMFAALRYRTVIATAAALGGIAVVLAAVAAPFAGPFGWLPFGCLVANAFAGALLAGRLRWELTAGMLAPFAKVLLPVALLNSMVVTLRQRGVRWRGTLYPLSQLRAGQVP
jgi:glycosyltransferase involved in cell wall biosynthesis